MSANAANLKSLPNELKKAILDSCDYPSIIKILHVNKFWNSISLSRAKDSERRLEFLIAHEPSSTLFICFTCVKLKRGDSFAQGQLASIWWCRHRIDRNNPQQNMTRFCTDCGVNREPIRYLRGCRIRMSTVPYDVHMCVRCRKRTYDYYCMKERLCFDCTEEGMLDTDFRGILTSLNPWKALQPLPNCRSCGGS